MMVYLFNGEGLFIESFGTSLDSDVMSCSIIVLAFLYPSCYP